MNKMYCGAYREAVLLGLGAAAAFVAGLPIVNAAEDAPLSPETIFEKHFKGDATVEFAVGEVATLNIDSVYRPGVSHAQIIKAKVAGAKDGQELVVIMSREVATRLLQLGIEDPAEHLRDKVLRVSGRVDRPTATQYKMRITRLDQLESIHKP